jgi:hypothetical protein
MAYNFLPLAPRLRRVESPSPFPKDEMRSLISLSLVFLAATLSGVARAVAINERAPCVAEICFDETFDSPSKRQVTPTFYGRELTNAQRLARGLPPNPPTRRGKLLVSFSDLFFLLNLSAAPTVAPRTQPSSLPSQTYNVVIQVLSDGTSLGYVAPDPNYWTPLLTPDINSALQVSFNLPVGATSGSQLGLALVCAHFATLLCHGPFDLNTDSLLAP